MSTIRIGVLSLVVILLIAAPAWGGDPLSTLNHRDKFFDITPWNGGLWVSGYPGLLLETKDSGAAFSAVDVRSHFALYSLDYFDQKRAVVSGPAGFLSFTQDGGKSWQAVKIETKNPLFGIDAVEGSELAWVVGHFNTIFHSADGGKSWQRQQYELPEDAEDEPGLNAVCFINTTTGWIAGEFGVILHTKDGGKTWLRQQTPIETPLYDIEFVDDMHGAAVGGEGEILFTVDGGETWTKRELENKRHLFSLSLKDGILFAVGQDGIFASGPAFEDGDWSVHRTGIYTWLDSVYFVSKTEGYAAGGRATILKTTDGGKSWKALAGR